MHQRRNTELNNRKAHFVMKKKITYILSLLMIVCMLGACGSDNAEKTYGGYTTDELHTEATDSLGNIQEVFCPFRSDMHFHTKTSYKVPKIRSPASPRPGTI